MTSSVPVLDGPKVPPKNWRRRVLADATAIFVRQDPNALGKAAYAYDLDGALYTAATTDKKYYPRTADIQALNEYADEYANRSRNIRRMIIVGPGPQEIFREKEAILLKALSGVDEVVTIDLAEHFNRQAGGVIEHLSRALKRPIRHKWLTMDYRAAAEKKLVQHGPSTLVVCTGGLITNTETKTPEIFPAAELQNDLKALGQLAGPEGKVLVTYDSNNDEKFVLSAYDTDAFKELYLHVIDEIQTYGSDKFPGIDRTNIEIKSRWNAKAQAVIHDLIFNDQIRLAHTDINGTFKANHGVHFYPNDNLIIIPSYKPSIDTMSENAEAVGMRDQMTTSVRRGSTLHLMTVGPK